MTKLMLRDDFDRDEVVLAGEVGLDALPAVLGFEVVPAVLGLDMLPAVLTRMGSIGPMIELLDGTTDVLLDSVMRMVLAGLVTGRDDPTVLPDLDFGAVVE
mmetsp:Transcript_43058/g.69879  ORF Transcript_43058/g.69879 Transcript_43058/m.69879 type:complete len:101 (-) Transcript_43058:1068-1370(-)|eukprot:CAMPEP_0184647576 /NCGR_PEP_ID=MMETSP0308-20130426/4541_1 /TAXON_ID=38269 /ORGANISM="Gloeochaete witrockiana, Strain SAG 46.84" /LENGTH=100 /DNA_ID=CAMNT_0027078671 /DNA_START=890 /DNA_END=1192 /DNA_ORIENTATION=+